jgi:hypothetical protein
MKVIRLKMEVIKVKMKVIRLMIVTYVTNQNEYRRNTVVYNIYEGQEGKKEKLENLSLLNWKILNMIRA